MPIGYHHFYYRDFVDHLSVIGLTAEVEQLSKLKAAEKELRNQADKLFFERKRLANTILENHYSALRPLLRPCHQKRFDASEKNVELEAQRYEL